MSEAERRDDREAGHLSARTLFYHVKGKANLTPEMEAHLRGCAFCQQHLKFTARTFAAGSEDGTFETEGFRALLHHDDRRELFSFSKAEGLAMAALLDHLSAELEDKGVGNLSRELADRLYDRMGTFKRPGER